MQPHTSRPNIEQSKTYVLREDIKHARARRGAQSSREIPTHVEPRVIEQKERPTPTQHHTRTHTPQAKHVCTRPTPPRTHRTTTEQRKPTHDYTHSELAERACKGAPQWKNQMWGPNQQLPRSQSGQSVSRVLGLVKCCWQVWVWVGQSGQSLSLVLGFGKCVAYDFFFISIIIFFIYIIIIMIFLFYK